MSRMQIITALLILLLVACTGNNENPAEDDKIKVVTTIAPYSDFIRNIGGEYVDVTTIVPSGTNAHSFEPSPQMLVKVADADIYFQVGAGFNFEEEFAFEGLTIIDCTDSIELVNNDPHVWLSVNNVKQILIQVEHNLSKIKPAQQTYFKSNLAEYSASLDSVFLSIQKSLQNAKNRHIFVYHNAWNYLARDLNLIVKEIEYGGKKPKLGDLEGHIKSAKSLSINTILADPNLNIESVEIIANEINADIKFINPLPTDYLNNLADIGKKLTKVLLNESSSPNK
jgi:zinc transport system substrate-binding protein